MDFNVVSKELLGANKLKKSGIIMLHNKNIEFNFATENIRCDSETKVIYIDDNYHITYIDSDAIECIKIYI